MKVLLVDDDRELVELLSFALLRAGLWPLPAYTRAQALEQLAAERPALILIDVHLEGESGFDLLEQIRETSDVPIMMISAAGSEEDKIRGFDLGADDYLTKPFGMREFMARVRARLRRGQTPPDDHRAMSRLEVGDLALDPFDCSVVKAGRRIWLTPTEFRLLHYLMRDAGRVVTSRWLMQQVWRDDSPTTTSPLRVTMHRLRRKLGESASPSGLLQSVAGIGFILKVGNGLEHAAPQALASQ